MQSRRDTLTMLALALGHTALLSDANAETEPAWPPYPRTLTIDGAGGPMLGFMEPNDPRIAAELDAIRASGLTGCVLTVAPNGQFWMDDAAVARTRASISNWDAIIARYRDYIGGAHGRRSVAGACRK